MMPLLDAPVTLDLEQAPVPRFAAAPARALEAEQFARVCEACRERERLRIDYYVPERDEVTSRQVDPYHVFAYGGDWYFAAFDHLRRDWRTFAVGERIRALQPTGERFEADAGFDLDRYLAEGFGIFRGGAVEEVILRFSPAVTPYLKERVWDETETKADLPDGGLELRMRVPVNVGLLRFVLQYGAEVEVMAPAGLREQMAGEGARLATLYHRGDRKRRD
jgi:proteasome accessory factor B